MADVTTEEKQDGQKTLVSFIVGLLIGGMLVWAFSGPAADAPSEEMVVDEAGDVADEVDTTVIDPVVNTVSDAADAVALPSLSVGDGSVTVNNQPAGSSVTLDRVTYPVSEGWIGVRQYNGGELGRYINGVVRFSESQGLVPEAVVLQQPTVAGQEYAIVIFAEDGDFAFSLENDVQIDQVFATFTAQ